MDGAALGICGEDAAARYFASRGCRILARRWRCKAGEIDLIVQDGEEVVFVEVKTRRPGDFGYPEEAVTRSKRDRLRRLAFAYMAGRDGSFRIDVVSVATAPRGGEWRIWHARSAVGEED